jgi:hypothetical protein
MVHLHFFRMAGIQLHFFTQTAIAQHPRGIGCFVVRVTSSLPALPACVFRVFPGHPVLSGVLPAPTVLVVALFAGEPVLDGLWGLNYPWPFESLPIAIAGCGIASECIPDFSCAWASHI